MDYSLWWRVKGYTGIHLTKEEIDNKKYSFCEIIDSDSKFIKQIETKLEKGGVVFALAKKNVIKAVYIFKLTIDNGEKVLVFDKKLVLDEVKKCIEEFEKDIHSVLGEIILHRHDITKAVWKGKEVDKKQKFKDYMAAVKVYAWLFTFFLGVIVLALIICGTSYSVTGFTMKSMEEVKKDELIIDYISNINHYNPSEAIDVISEINNPDGLVVSQIIIPTVIMIAGYFLLISSLLDVLELIKGAVDNKTLFTNDKNQVLRKILFKIFIGSIFVSLNNIILWLGVGAVLSIIQYMFNYCVQLTTDKK